MVSGIPIFSFHFQEFHYPFLVYLDHIFSFPFLVRKNSRMKTEMTEKIRFTYLNHPRVQFHVNFTLTLVDLSGSKMCRLFSVSAELRRDTAMVNGPDPSLLAGIVSIAYIQINKRDFINKKSHNAARRRTEIFRPTERETRSSNRFPESAINTVCAATSDSASLTSFKNRNETVCLLIM